MNITDELREWASVEVPYKYGHQLTAIADRIDEEHERVCNEQYACGAEHGIGASIEASMIQDHGYIELPKDADGEYIHIGDVMESKGSDFLFDEASFEVRSMRCDECGWEVYDRLGDRYAPSLLRHHHAPTVEDVLREFGRGWHEQMNAPETFDIADYVERYAAKLQLREDA